MVYILLADGFEEMEALVPADLLRRAGIEVALVGVHGQTIQGAHQVVVQADCTLDAVDFARAEMVVLPGGGLGVENLEKCPEVKTLVEEVVARNLWLAAICAAPTLLGRWGFLDGKRAVCYPSWSDRLIGAEYVEGDKWIQDGKIITAQAAGSSFAFGLQLISVLVGEELAQRVKEEIYL